MSSKTNLDVVFGCMTFGREGEEQVRTSNLNDCAAILDTFQSYGHTEVDTSRFYGVRTPYSLTTHFISLTVLGWLIRRVPPETGLAEAWLDNGHEVFPKCSWFLW
jgi:aryl-alcohol dehydrogenase-like predicted oxidoreductase